MNVDNLAWTAYGFSLEGKNVWFTTYWGAYLCCYSLYEKRMLRIEPIPYEGRNGELLYSNIFVDRNKVILIPTNTEEIGIYDIEKREFSFVNIIYEENRNNKYCGYKIYNQSLYIFPYNDISILKLNLETNAVEIVCGLKQFDNKDVPVAIFQYHYASVEERMYFLSSFTNSVFEFNIVNESFRVIEVGEVSNIYCAIYHLEKNEFALADQEGNLTIADLETGKYKKYKNSIKDFCPLEMYKNRNAFADIFQYEEWLYLFPAQANKVIRFSMIQKKFEEVNIYGMGSLKVDDYYRSKSRKFSLLMKRKMCVYGFFMGNCNFFEYHIGSNEIDFYPIEMNVSEEDSMFMMKRLIKKGKVNESKRSYESLKTFLKVVKEETLSSLIENDSSIGSKVVSYYDGGNV